MNRKSVVFVVLIMGLGLLTRAYAWPALGSFAAGDELVGLLGVVWIDYEDGRPGDVAFLLQPAPGEAFRLLPGMVSEGDLLALAGQKVRVKGREEPAALTDSANPGLLVESIEPARGLVRDGTSDRQSAAISGNSRWITIGCKFPDRLGEEHPLSYFDEMYANVFPGLDHYWREVSYDKINLAGSGAVGWYILPKPYADYFYSDGVLNFTVYRDDCLAAADGDVYYPDYFGFNLLLNNDDMDAAYGSAYNRLELDGVTREWSVTYMSQWSHGRVSVFEHEMGHGYGLSHSFVGPGPNPYNNMWDVMSRDAARCSLFSDPVYGCYGQHTIASNKEILSWIEPNRIFTAKSGTQTIALERSAQPGPSGYLMAKVPLDNRGWHYTLEARRLVGYDQKLYDAVIIHEIGDPSGARLVTEGNVDYSIGPEAIWLPGETFYSTKGEGAIVHIDSATSTGYVVTITSGLESAVRLLYPTDDTYIARDAPNANHGAETTMLAGPAASDGISKRAMIKFDSKQLPPTTTKLRLKVAVIGSEGLTSTNIAYWTPPNYPSSSLPWTEEDLTWDNRNDEMRQLAGAYRDGQWLTWDVTYAWTGFGSASFAIGGGEALQTVTYSSKEGSNSPVLIVDYLVSPGSVTATPTNTPRPTAKPTATRTPSPTATATRTASPTPTPTATSVPGTATMTATATETAEPTATASSQETPGPTPTPSTTPEPGQPPYVIWLPVVEG